MQKSWGAILFGLGFVGVAASGTLAGCGGGGVRPDVTNDDGEGDGGGGSGSNDGGRTTVDGGDGGTKELDPSCSNTIKDVTETDVDCGGTCGECIDGKTCSAATDCLGGACIGNVCATPNCGNAKTDPGETDVDCGGSTCRRCTTGKSCKAATDCVSGTCNAGQCSCPAGMQIAARKDGTNYCIDEIEVSKFAYNQFIKAGVLPATQIDACKTANGTFTPRDAWIPSNSYPTGLATSDVALAFNYSLPVHYVDWCDAYAYCAWAKKELCGSTNGGAADYTKGKDETADAWYNACSGHGDLQYPYDTSSYNRNACNGGQGVGAPSDDANAGPRQVSPPRSGYGAVGSKDEGIYASVNGSLTGTYAETDINFKTCVGGFTKIYGMSGNVAEWENSCESDSATAKCRARGGSYKTGVDNAAGMRCDDLSRTEQRVPPMPVGGAEDVLKDIGFRCCVF